MLHHCASEKENGIFSQFYLKLKKFLQKYKCAYLDATFVTNLASFSLLSPQTSFGEKTVTHPPRHISPPVNLSTISTNWQHDLENDLSCVEWDVKHRKKTE